MRILKIDTEKALFDILDKYIDPFLRNVRVKHFVKEVYIKHKELCQNLYRSTSSEPQGSPMSLKSKLERAKLKAHTNDGQQTVTNKTPRNIDDSSEL